MKNLSLFIVISIGLLVASCGGNSKKVLVMASGKITIDGNTVSLEPGTTHNEQEMIVSGDKITVKSITKRLTQEDLQKNIDSLQQLMAGTNVSAANKNFCIAPGKLAMITVNTNAQIIGPYLKMPSSFEGGKEYEIYKFSTNKEMVETVEKLKKLQ